MRIAIIPARGGSKRIPRKNIRSFCGKPIIAWPIAAARKSGLFDRILVSTDDDEIADVASQLGAEIPFRRPPHLANDTAITADVIVDSIRWFQAKGHAPSACCCIYPTAAFLLPDDLADAVSLLEKSTKKYVFAATEYRHPVQRAMFLTQTGGVEMFHPEYAHTRTQDLVPAIHDAGMFYLGRTDAWLESLPIFSEAATPLILPGRRAVDIDNEQDWQLAELLFAAQEDLQEQT